MRFLIIIFIRFYQKTISRIFPSSCRFYPSCSEYTVQALENYGLLKGSWLGLKRIAKCHPFHPGGVDEIAKNNFKGDLKCLIM